MVKERGNNVRLRDKDFVNILCETQKVSDDSKDCCKYCKRLLEREERCKIVSSLEEKKYLKREA